MSVGHPTSPALCYSFGLVFGVSAVLLGFAFKWRQARRLRHLHLLHSQARADEAGNLPPQHQGCSESQLRQHTVLYTYDPRSSIAETSETSQAHLQKHLVRDMVISGEWAGMAAVLVLCL